MVILCIIYDLLFVKTTQDQDKLSVTIRRDKKEVSHLIDLRLSFRFFTRSNPFNKFKVNWGNFSYGNSTYILVHN